METDCLLHVLVAGEIPFLHVSSVCTKELEQLQEGPAERVESRKHNWLWRGGSQSCAMGQRGHRSSEEDGWWNESRVLVWYHTYVRHRLGQKRSLYFAGDVYALSRKPRALLYM